MHELKLKYEHIRDKQFYLRVGDEYTIHLILGDNTFSRIKTEEVIKGIPNSRGCHIWLHYSWGR